MLLNLTDLSAEPLHRQISRQVLEKILDGDLSPGVELAPARAVAREQHVSVNCVERAYDELRRDGLLIAQNGAAFSVAPLSQEQKQAISRHRLLGLESSLNVLESFAQQLVSVFDPEKLCAIFAENLQTYLRTPGTYFVFYDETAAEFNLLASEQDPESVRIDPTDDFVEAMQQSRMPMAIEQGESDAIDSPLLYELRKRHAVLAFPLIEANKLFGVVALTAKTSGVSYSPEDRRLTTVLANQFVTALLTARFYVEAVRKRQMEEELQMARQIQAGLLPRELPNSDNLQLAVHCEAADVIGGDFYDLLPLDSQHMGLVIADACGKGLPAALLISQIQAIVKSEAGHGTSIGKMLYNLNQHVKRYAAAKNFATLFYGIYDRSTGILEFANAGHNPPLLVRQDGHVEWLRTTGPALGLLAEVEHETITAEINTGDCLLLYTDGVTETMDDRGEQFGEDRLQEILLRLRHCSPSKILNDTLKELNTYQAIDALRDDRTLVVLKITG